MSSKSTILEPSYGEITECPILLQKCLLLEISWMSSRLIKLTTGNSQKYLKKSSGISAGCVTVKGKDIPVEVFFSADYKFLLMTMGLSGASSTRACLSCHVPKEDRTALCTNLWIIMNLQTARAHWKHSAKNSHYSKLIKRTLLLLYLLQLMFLTLVALACIHLSGHLSPIVRRRTFDTCSQVEESGGHVQWCCSLETPEISTMFSDAALLKLQRYPTAVGR